MMHYIIRTLVLLSMLVIGIYIGIHMAEKNMQQMQGTEGAPRAIQITPQKDGKIEISVLGQVVETKNPTEKMDQQKVAQLKDQMTEETDRLSELGNFIGHELREKARGLLGWMFSWVR